MTPYEPVAFEPGARVRIDYPPSAFHGDAGTVLAAIFDDDQLRYDVDLGDGIGDESTASMLEAARGD